MRKYSTRRGISYVDFNGGNFTNAGELEQKLNFCLSEWEHLYDMPVRQNELGYGDRFVEILRTAHAKTGRRAVVLIDEYDKPILDVLDMSRELENRQKKEDLIRALFILRKALETYPGRVDEE